MARKVDFNFAIEYDKLQNIFIYKDSENVEANFSKITFAESNSNDNREVRYVDHDIQYMPLDDIIDACKSLGYKGIIDLYCVGGGKSIDDNIDAIRVIQEEYNDYAIIMGHHINFSNCIAEDSDSSDDIIELGPMDCIDDNPYFAPYPYTGWTRYIYTGCLLITTPNTKRYDLIATRALRYRLAKEYEKINKLLNVLSKTEETEMIEEYRDYKKALEELMSII